MGGGTFNMLFLAPNVTLFGSTAVTPKMFSFSIFMSLSSGLILLTEGENLKTKIKNRSWRLRYRKLKKKTSGKDWDRGKFTTTFYTCLRTSEYVGESAYKHMGPPIWCEYTGTMTLYDTTPPILEIRYVFQNKFAGENNLLSCEKSSWAK